jgi:hypothetical protein
MWIVMHRCMDATVGLSLYSYLYFKLAKALCLSSFLLCFLYYKIGKQEGRKGSARKREQGEVAQTMCTPVSKCKNDKTRKKIEIVYENL